ncbi:MAG: MOSC domain-containing protein [Boseongicola sp. SB0673_bin_14]|nr:MOSC domain-containing protein [Boseongicola sp. SB0667_bin_21]MYI70183.1 MOSC domain-containing protein [Boseongicola sp. SB0673_bin_14]
MRFRNADELEAGLPCILASPKDEGVIAMIVRRPETDSREEMAVGELDVYGGLVGDNWRARGSGRTGDGSAHPDMQLTLMNSRTISLLAGPRDRWALAGDQFYVDLDLSRENLPAGTRLTIGSATVEVTDVPHTGCKKFMSRFGTDALKLVNSRRGRELCLRGINARVVVPGRVEEGDKIQKEQAGTT